MAELSYQNAEMLYMALSQIARENLSILDNEELSAVQVLIGSMMGIRPRKTKGEKEDTTTFHYNNYYNKNDY